MFLCSPSLFILTRGSQDHIFSGCGLSYVMPTVVAILLAHTVTSAFIQAWVPLWLSVCTLVYALLGPLHNTFPTWNPVDNEARAIDRYVICRYRRQGIGKHVPRCVFEGMHTCYWAILNKLYIAESEQPEVTAGQPVLHDTNLDSRKGHISRKDEKIAG